MKISYILLFVFLGMVTACGRSPERLAKRGLAALDAGRLEEAVSFLERALDSRSDSRSDSRADSRLDSRADSRLDSRALNQAGDAEAASLWGALGLARGRLGHAGLAEDAFRIASALAEEDFWIHVNYGGLLIREGRFTEALDPLSVAVRADLYRTEALELMARAALRLEDEDLARRLLEEAALRANEPRVLTSLATIAANDVESRQRLQEALDLDPAYGPAALNLAILMDRSGEETHWALHYYERYLSVTSAQGVDPAVRDRIAVLKRRRDEPGRAEDPSVLQAREFLTRSREAMRVGNSVLALNLATRAAQLAQRSGRIDLEERALRQGLDAAPGQARAHAAMGQFYLDQGRNKEALTAFREAARLAPEALPAQMGLARAAAAARQSALAGEALERAEALATTGEALEEIVAVYRDGLRDRRSARRVERVRADRFPE